MRKVHFATIMAVIMAEVLLSAGLSAYTVNGTVVTLVAATDFYADDNTTLIQSLLNNTNYTKIIIPPGTNNASWKVRPLTINHSNIEIHLNADTTLEAKPGGYPSGNSCVLSATSLNNITVTGDAGAKILMHKEEYALLPAAEWRHALKFVSCTGVTVSGLILANTGGDGIYLGACSSVTMNNVVIDGAARNGLAVISVDGLTVTNCTFKNTSGQGNVATDGPWAGIDLEPNSSSERLTNIVIDSCVFQNNNGSGFLSNATNLNGSADILSMTATNCAMQGNGENGIEVDFIPASLSDSSCVIFQNCTISDNDYCGVLVKSKAIDAGTLSLY